MTTYVDLHNTRVKEMRKVHKQTLGILPNILEQMLREVDEYDEEYLQYAQEADAFDADTDNVELRLLSFTLHKRQDVTGKTEFYYAYVIGDDNKLKSDPDFYVLDQYRQLKKDETWTFPSGGLRIYEGNPKGELQYQIMCFDTQRTNHDKNVEAAQAIVTAATTAVATIVGGPAAGTVGVGVAAVGEAITNAAINHDDEMFDTFLGTLTVNDPVPADHGPYSLALPKIKLETERITVMLQVNRVANARGKAKQEPTRPDLVAKPLGPKVATTPRVKPGTVRRPRSG